jgi:hypothetical protein
MSVALALFERLVTCGNLLEEVRDTYPPASDQWLWHTEVLGLLDEAIDGLVRSSGLGGEDDE